MYPLLTLHVHHSWARGYAVHCPHVGTQTDGIATIYLQLSPAMAEGRGNAANCILALKVFHSEITNVTSAHISLSISKFWQ